MDKAKKTYAPLEQELIEACEYRLAHSETMLPVIRKSREHAVEFLKSNGLPSRKDEQWKNSMFPKHYDQQFITDISSVPYSKSLDDIFKCEVHGFWANTYSMLNGWY